MADDRDFREYQNSKWPEKKTRVSLREYLIKLIADPSRSKELEDWIKLYGAQRLEQIIEPKIEEKP
jgi:hypothetical protein